MSMNVEGSGDRWFSDMPRIGRIYRLIDNAGSEMNRESRLEAISLLGESGDPRAVDILIHCCSDEDPQVRQCAVGALGKIRSGRAVSALIQCLNEKKEPQETRMGAVLALAATRSDSAMSGLRAHLSDPDEDPAVRSIIADALTDTQKR